jgi:carboxylesterase
MAAPPEKGEEPYERAARAHDRIAAEEDASGGIAWRSILLSHGRRTARSYVLLHGLTASPRQFEAFARRLHERGANVFVPRLPRHGHDDRLTGVLAALSVEELATTARDAVAIGQGLGEHVTVVGFSVGGLLSAWVAQHLCVDRVVCIAPFLGVGWLPRRAVPIVSGLARRLPNRFIWWNPFERAEHGPPHTYPRFPTRAVGNALRLALDVLGAAAARTPATSRIVLVTNAAETTVNNRSVARLAAAWRTHPGVVVDTHVLAGLPRSHDIIEPRRLRPLAERVYPTLLEIVTAPSEREQERN